MQHLPDSSEGARPLVRLGRCHTSLNGSRHSPLPGQRLLWMRLGAFVCSLITIQLWTPHTNSAFPSFLTNQRTTAVTVFFGATTKREVVFAAGVASA